MVSHACRFAVFARSLPRLSPYAGSRGGPPFQGKRLVLLFSNDLIDIVLIDTDERNKAERVDLIFAHNDVMAIAAAAEAEEKKSEAAVISVGGYDLRGSDLEAVKDGRLNAESSVR